MKTEENQLTIIPYFKEFENVCSINKTSSLLLDNMRVYALNNNVIDREVAFKIIKKSDEKYILPICNLERYDSFLLAAEKLVNVRTFKTKADESFTFYMEETC